MRDLTVSCFECDKVMKYIGKQECNDAVATHTESIFRCEKCKRLVLVSNGDWDGEPEDMILRLTHPIDPKEAEEFYLAHLPIGAK